MRDRRLYAARIQDLEPKLAIAREALEMIAGHVRYDDQYLAREALAKIDEVK